MNIEGIEKEEGKVCTKCGIWKVLEEYNKSKHSKDGRKTICRKCQKEYKKQWTKNNKEHIKQYYQNNKEHFKEQNKQWEENNKEHRKEYKKQWRENNSEYNKQWYKQNKEHIKQYRENNKEQNKQWREDNKEHLKEYGKQYRENNKQNNLQCISNVLEQINPKFKQLNLPIYGYVYMFENIKTGHKYVGQSIKPIARRYTGGIVRGWIKHRKSFKNQKFKDELIEDDIQVTEVLDVAFCQYHLDKLESWYIDKYDSCNNGYNNEHGNHNTTDGIKEFNEILADHNLEFKDGKLIQIKAPTQE